MKSELVKLTYKIKLNADEELTLPASLIKNIGAGEWIITIEQLPTQKKIRNHDAFKKSYAPSDEGLYDDYPTR